MTSFERILFIRLSAVGDVINTLPALGALRKGFPKAHIGFLVEDRARDLITRHPCVDRVHLFPRKRWGRMMKNPFQWSRMASEMVRFATELRRERYDVALDLQGNLKGALHGILSAAPVRVGFGRGFCKEYSHFFTHIHVVPPQPILNRVDKFLSMVARVGAPVSRPEYRIPESPDSRRRVEEFLREQGLEPGKFAALHPGTSDFGKAKRWMPERFAELAVHLRKAHGLRSIVTWGPGELDLARQVADASGGAAVPALETRSLLDLAELLRQAKVFIGCDSGPLHLSSAVGVPSVALFGPKDPRVYGPYNPRSRVVQPDSAAMSGITVEAVSSSVNDLLHSFAG